MRTKRWLLIFVSAAALALGVYTAINTPAGSTDPAQDWHSPIETDDPRLARLTYLEQHHEEYDAYIIGSSPAAAYDPVQLNEYTGCRFYNLFTCGADTSLLAGEARYLLENYEVKHLILDLGLDEASLFQEGAALSPAFDDFAIETDCCGNPVRDVERIGDLAQYTDAHAGDFGSTDLSYLPEDPEDCAASVRQIQTLCKEHGVELTVVFSPVCLSQQQFDPAAIKSYKRSIAEVTDFWDFSYSSVSFETRYFYDSTHFRSAVARMCLARMFGDESIYIPEDFGIYVTEDTVETLCASYDAPICPDPRQYSIDVPILMYHHIDDQANSDTIMTRETFRAQMELLHEAGVHTVSLDEMYRYVFYGEELPDHPVLITFDDGYLSNYEIAFPILRELGMKAVIFAIGISIGCETYKDTEFAVIPHFGYDQIREMLSSGVMDIQSHTYDMHQWAPFEAGTPVRASILRFDGESEAEYCAALRSDIQAYRQEYSENTGAQFIALAYPTGRYDMLSESVLHAEGIPITIAGKSKSANTLVKGLPQTLYALSRMGVTENTEAGKILDYVLPNR